MSSPNNHPASAHADTGDPQPRRWRLLKKIGVVLAVLVVGLLALVAIQPAEFRVTRTATISAPPDEVFAQVNDFHQWEAWSPWAELDPAAKNSFEGPTAGTGATFRWAGDSNVGKGSMTITESRPNEFIAIELEFIEPMAGTSTAQFTFQPSGDNQTSVTWTMFGENGFVGKAMGLVIDCDKMMGVWFEEGLANLKTVVELAGKT